MLSPRAHLRADGNQELCEASSSSGLSCPIYLQGLQHNVTSVQVDVSPQHLMFNYDLAAACADKSLSDSLSLTLSDTAGMGHLIYGSAACVHVSLTFTFT